MISKALCVERRLYQIHSRNLVLGVYREKTGGFLGLREKFGEVYVFEEYHHDNGSPYGTVSPIQALAEDLPPEIELKETIGTFCQTCGLQMEYVRWPDGEREVDCGGYLMRVPGEWRHLDETDCQKLRPACRENAALHQWLENMEKRYKDLIDSYEC